MVSGKISIPFGTLIQEYLKDELPFFLWIVAWLKETTLTDAAGHNCAQLDCGAAFFAIANGVGLHADDSENDHLGSGVLDSCQDYESRSATTPHSKHGDLWESSVDSTSNCYAKYISSRLVFLIKQGFGHFGGRQELKQLKTRWNCWVDFACFHDKRIVEGKLLVSAFKCQFLTLAMYFTSWNCISLVQNECMNNLLDLGVLNTMEIPPPPTTQYWIGLIHCLRLMH